MDNPRKVVSVPVRTIFRGLIVLLLVGAIAFCAWQKSEDRRRQEEITTAEGIARVVSSTFSGKDKLLVGVQSGTLDVTSVNHGTLFDSVQKIIVPFSVGYFLELGQLDLSHYRWDRSTRTLIVAVDGIELGEPNIDESKSSVIFTKGIWVSREASINLAHRAAILSVKGARAEAEKPENLRKARDEGRSKFAQLLQGPLQIAGLGDVNVVVRYPQDGLSNGERWDVSPSINEVLSRKP
jgi:hypothetical protein